MVLGRISPAKNRQPINMTEPLKDDVLTTQDIMVYVIVVLIVLNIVISSTICYMLRGRGRAKEGLSRHGSKYYIKKRPTNDFTNHGLHNPSTAEMIEVNPEEPWHCMSSNDRAWRNKLTSPKF